MQLKQFLAPKNILKFLYTIRTSNGKTYVNILDDTGTVIGYGLFKNNRLQRLKFYKPDYIKTIDDRDRLQVSIEAFVYRRVLITETVFNELVERAVVIADEDIKAKRIGRKIHPCKYKRKKLQGRSVRRILFDLANTFGTIK